MADKKTMGGSMLKHFDLPENWIDKIFEAQKAFGSKFCPFDQLIKEPTTNLKKLEWIDTFLDCVDDEISEVRNWLPWKHWRRYNDFVYQDLEIRFELIDMLHFVVSLMILLDIEPYLPMNLKIEGRKECTNEYLRYIIAYVGDSYHEDDLHKLQDNVQRIFRHLCQLFVIWEMTDNDIYDYYMSKNAENFARQERGY